MTCPMPRDIPRLDDEGIPLFTNGAFSCSRIARCAIGSRSLMEEFMIGVIFTDHQIVRLIFRPYFINMMHLSSYRQWTP
jgi:hypothetical protein